MPQPDEASSPVTTSDNIELQIFTADGHPFPIPVDGSLGLLALGDIGLLAWRRKRAMFSQQQLQLPKEEQTTTDSSN